MNSKHNNVLGRVLRANTRGFTFGTRVPKTGVPIFGSLVKARIAHRSTTVFGIIYNIEIKDNGMAKMLSVSDDVRPEEVAWLQDQVVPVEATVMCVGYQEQSPIGSLRHALPSQPPITLDLVHDCDEQEVSQFTTVPTYLRLMLEHPDAPADELIAASTRLTVELLQPANSREAFVIATGRELARLLARDGARLEGLLQRICM